MPEMRFKCRACEGTGGTGPLRISTGKPFNPCMYCDGTGVLVREVESKEAFDRIAKGRALASGKVGPAFHDELKYQRKIVEQEWNTAYASISRKRAVNTTTATEEKP